METERQVEVSQRVEFTCSYLVREDKDSYILNSHHYRFEATVCGLENYETTGRVISFEDLKKAIRAIVPDSQFLYDSNDVNQEILARDFKNCGVKCMDFEGEISTERILEEISLLLVESLEGFSEVYLKETKLRENSNSFVSWKQEVINNGV